MSIIEFLCIIICSLHFFVSLLSSLLQGKKLKKICDKCNQPVFEDEVHDCLDSDQLKKLVDFVSSLKKG